MTKQKKILLKSLLKEYKQLLKESIEVDNIVQIDLKKLKIYFQEASMKEIKGLINRYGNEWRVAKINANIGSKNITFATILSLRNDRIDQFIPLEALNKTK